MEWFLPTRAWRQMHGLDDGETGVDSGMAEQGLAGIGAWSAGRNMFGPVRGPWPHESWRDWWGGEPPRHTPMFVLTRHPRAPLRMAGGTAFRFVTQGLDAALAQVTVAADGRDVHLGGGVATVPAVPACGTCRRAASGDPGRAARRRRASVGRPGSAGAGP